MKRVFYSGFISGLQTPTRSKRRKSGIYCTSRPLASLWKITHKYRHMQGCAASSFWVVIHYLCFSLMLRLLTWKFCDVRSASCLFATFMMIKISSYLKTTSQAWYTQTLRSVEGATVGSPHYRMPFFWSFLNSDHYRPCLVSILHMCHLGLADTEW